MDSDEFECSVVPVVVACESVDVGPASVHYDCLDGGVSAVVSETVPVVCVGSVTESLKGVDLTVVSHVEESGVSA